MALPLPKPLRLSTFFEGEARSLQEFASKCQGKEWPAPSARPHVRVTDNEVHVWYSSDEEREPSLRWEPLNRARLGL